jgi:hypothetical protein
VKACLRQGEDRATFQITLIFGRICKFLSAFLTT